MLVLTTSTKDKWQPLGCITELVGKSLQMEPSRKACGKMVFTSLQTATSIRFNRFSIKSQKESAQSYEITGKASASSTFQASKRPATSLSQLLWNSQSITNMKAIIHRISSTMEPGSDRRSWIIMDSDRLARRSTTTVDLADLSPRRNWVKGGYQLLRRTLTRSFYYRIISILNGPYLRTATITSV